MGAKVVHCKKEFYDILIDRTTKWGNPFKVGGGVIWEDQIFHLIILMFLFHS